VAEVRGRAPVLVDGGFLRGTDVVKAMALGATAVGVGRLECFGLAAAGEDGLVRALEILEHEMTVSMALMGAAGLGELDPRCVTSGVPVCDSHVVSAFPHLELDRWRY
jgi:glycolate oxidase